MVIWITGLSGAGKTTIARLLCDRRRREGHPILLLDGDSLRSIFADRDGYGRAERLRLARSYARLCRMVSHQGIDVACATISLFHEIHEWNRANLPRYLEIYLRVSLDLLKSRDDNGLYRRAQEGTAVNVYGIDLVPEEPLAPDMIIDNEESMTIDEVVERILTRMETAQ
jgi:cytidine diphosphoramidate kinase